MHFFYLDESGDTGKDLTNVEQPIFILGGVSLRDEGWNKTHTEYTKLVASFIGAIPTDFELHSGELLGVNGFGPFAGKSPTDRYKFAQDVLDLIAERKHNIHFIALDKSKIKTTSCGLPLSYNPSRPYLLGFDYMVTYINEHVKSKLGRSARGMIIADEKDQYRKDVENITHARRFGGTMSHRVKWIVEISYAVDSKKNTMIQLSDLCIYCIRRFIEIEHGYHPTWPAAAGKFYAECYKKIDARVTTKGLVQFPDPKLAKLNSYLGATRIQVKSS